MRTIATALVATLTFCASGFARAEGVMGNGGATWVCRENATGPIRWSKLLDLFEATDEYELALGQYSGPMSKIAEQIQTRLGEADPDLAAAVAPELKSLDLFLNPQITFTNDILETIDDALHHLRPAPESCAGGAISYEQLVNYKPDGRILIQNGIFNSLSETEKTAVLFHEAIYKFRRDFHGDTDSSASRRAVGLLFSNLSVENLQNALVATGVGELDDYEMRFVPVYPGTFLMGGPTGNSDCNHMPHLVTLSQPYEIQVTDVTQAQYVEVMGVNPSKFQKPENCPNDFEKIQGVSACPNHPVENVSWDDAQEFIAKLNSSRNGIHRYRLPTEAEWEYAERAGTNATYSFGNDASQLPQYGWFQENSGAQTHAVAQLKPNGLGLYDMQGNVSQWVQDGYTRFGPQPQVDPLTPFTDGRVARGGSWIDPSDLLAAYARVWTAQTLIDSTQGFRIVRVR